jgi:hypothetical protein
MRRSVRRSVGKIYSLISGGGAEGLTAKGINAVRATMRIADFSPHIISNGPETPVALTIGAYHTYRADDRLNAQSPM